MTTDTPTLTDWLLEQIAADEAVAQAAARGGWALDDPASDQVVLTDNQGYSLAGSKCGCEVTFDGADATHIAAHDPARVLAQCAAHRAIVEKAQRAEVAFDRQINPASSAAVMAMLEVVQQLARIYADRPGFQEAWA